MSKKKKHDKGEEPKKEKKAETKGKASSTRKKKPLTVSVSSDDIALRAYFIAEHRQKHALPGDEAGDWIEAERQLHKESRKKK